jgi:PqqD family protein of HPr-rel-A system
MLAAPTQFWGICRGCTLLWRNWDGEQIVYNTGSGDTHYLDFLSAAILKKLECAPAAVPELASCISCHDQSDPAENAYEHIEILLGNLLSVGLIEPVAL